MDSNSAAEALPVLASSGRGVIVSGRAAAMRAATLLVLLLAGCDKRPARELSAEPLFAVSDGACDLETGRPAPGAPAEGLWSYQDPATSHRVAAIIGPARSAVGATRVTRPVEVLEARPGSDTIRHATDTASLRLEFIPPFARPAAVYSIGSRVVLASYEPCGSERHQPLIRYLRQDARGRVATDVVLQREARP